jgi:hypothetical protein
MRSKYCEALHLVAGDRNKRTASKPTVATVGFWPETVVEPARTQAFMVEPGCKGDLACRCLASPTPFDRKFGISHG